MTGMYRLGERPLTLDGGWTGRVKVTRAALSLPGRTTRRGTRMRAKADLLYRIVDLDTHALTRSHHVPVPLVRLISRPSTRSTT